MRLAFLCDFDGTVAPRDIGAEFVLRFAGGRDGELAALLSRWRAGEIDTRRIIQEESGMLEVSEAEALAFARDFELDPGFVPFVREVERGGDRVVVVSEGYDFYVRDRLQSAGLGELPWSANRTRFEGRRVRVEFPEVEGGCGRCGNCKGARVREHRALGYEVVLVGDGLSDRCGARTADHVVARGELLGFCARKGIPAVPFASFDDVARHARTLVRGRATRGGLEPATGGAVS